MNHRARGGRAASVVPVLLYHSISPAGGRFSTEPGTFAAHLDALRASGRQARTITDLVDPVDAAPEDGAAVVVTFDDGFADNLDVALPMLVDRAIPATLFVTSAYVRGEMPVPGRMLSPAGVRELHSAGVEIGSHGWHHRSLDRLSRAEIRDEVRSSREWLEDLIGSEVVSFAYPHGHFDRRCRDEVAAAGYRSASAVMNAAARPGGDRYAIARLTVEQHHDAGDVEAMLMADEAPLRVHARTSLGSLRRRLHRADPPAQPWSRRSSFQVLNRS